MGVFNWLFNKLLRRWLRRAGIGHDKDVTVDSIVAHNALLQFQVRVLQARMEEYRTAAKMFAEKDKEPKSGQQQRWN